jgi:hypothetical protein
MSGWGVRQRFTRPDAWHRGRDLGLPHCPHGGPFQRLVAHGGMSLSRGPRGLHHLFAPRASRSLHHVDPRWQCSPRHRTVNLYARASRYGRGNGGRTCTPPHRYGVAAAGWSLPKRLVPLHDGRHMLVPLEALSPQEAGSDVFTITRAALEGWQSGRR